MIPRRRICFVNIALVPRWCIWVMIRSSVDASHAASAASSLRFPEEIGAKLSAQRLAGEGPAGASPCPTSRSESDILSRLRPGPRPGDRRRCFRLRNRNTAGAGADQNVTTTLPIATGGRDACRMGFSTTHGTLPRKGRNSRPRNFGVDAGSRGSPALNRRRHARQADPVGEQCDAGGDEIGIARGARHR